MHDGTICFGDKGTIGKILKKHVGCDYVEEMKSNECKNGESSEMLILHLLYSLTE